MNNTGFLKILIVFIFIILISCFSCKKKSDEPIEDYRVKFTGEYFCDGECCDWNEIIGEDTCYTNTITLIVKIDTTSLDKIYVNNNLIPIDTSGVFWAYPFNHNGDYMIRFYSEDSVYHYISTGGHAIGHCEKYFGKK